MKNKIRKEIGNYLVIDPEICHGKLTFKGTRIFASLIIEQISNGQDIDSIIKSWGGKISKEAIIEAIFFYVKLFYNSNSNTIKKIISDKKLVYDHS